MLSKRPYDNVCLISEPTCISYWLSEEAHKESPWLVAVALALEHFIDQLDLKDTFKTKMGKRRLQYAVPMVLKHRVTLRDFASSRSLVPVRLYQTCAERLSYPQDRRLLANTLADTRAAGRRGSRHVPFETAELLHRLFGYHERERKRAASIAAWLFEMLEQYEPAAEIEPDVEAAHEQVTKAMDLGEEEVSALLGFERGLSEPDLAYLIGPTSPIDQVVRGRLMHFVQLHVDASERVRSLRAEQARPLTPQEHGNLVREWIHYHRAWRSLGEGTSPPIDARDRTLATFQELTSTIDEMEHQIIQDVLMLFHREVLPCIR